MAFMENPDYMDNIKTYSFLTSVIAIGSNGSKITKTINEIAERIDDCRMKKTIPTYDIDSMTDEELKEKADRLFLEKKYRTLRYEKEHLSDPDTMNYILIGGSVLVICGCAASIIIAMKKYA